VKESPFVATQFATEEQGWSGLAQTAWRRPLSSLQSSGARQAGGMRWHCWYQPAARYSTRLPMRGSWTGSK